MAVTVPFPEPDWPVSGRVRALTTRRHLPGEGGASEGPWASFNLGDHVGDRPGAVAANRRRLRQQLALPGEPAWLRQVHGTDVLELPAGPVEPTADAAVATSPGQVCAVLTADCLPVFLARRDGTAVGLAHAGWRGLAGAVIERTVARLPGEPSALAAWLGPAIGPDAFQVGAEVRDAFLDQDSGAAEAFVRDREGRWRADLYRLASRRLAALGVNWIGGGGACTFSESERYFSHRREAPCGRMASLIWIDPR